MQTQTQSPKIGRRRGGGCGDSAVEEAAAAADTDMQVITLLFISYMVVRPSVRPSVRPFRTYRGEKRGTRAPLIWSLKRRK